MKRIAMIGLLVLALSGCGNDESLVNVAYADGGNWIVRCRCTDAGYNYNATVGVDEWMVVRDAGHRLHSGYAVVDYVSQEAFIPGGGAVGYLSLLRWNNDGDGFLAFGNGSTFAMRCVV